MKHGGLMVGTLDSGSSRPSSKQALRRVLGQDALRPVTQPVFGVQLDAIFVAF